MNYRLGFRKTSKQVRAIELMKQYQEVLLEGGSRASKTFISIYAIIARGLQHESRHLVLRKHFNHAKLSLWHQTIPAVFKIAFPNVKYKENKVDWFIEYGNNSQIWIAGTDDKDRIEKILGSEFATIFMNEISEQSYNTYETIKTRLNPPKNMRPLLLLDQNPPKKTHWSYIKFHEQKNPETKQPLSDTDKARQVYFKMNPVDNLENLNPAYINTLESLSERKKKRFLYGEYGDDTEGALWKSQWIEDNRYNSIPDNIIRCIVAIDPNVTEDKKVNENTDEAGIITAGKIKVNGEDHYIVMSDDSTIGLSWGEKAVEIYRKYKADKIIAEVNQGGDLVEMNIRNYDRQVPFDDVRASRGKEVRAEPVADLYRRGYVHHCGEFPELEAELTSWVSGQGRSPNRLDALVWAIAYLSGMYQSNARIIMYGGEIC